MNDYGGSGGGFHALGKTPDPCGVKFSLVKALLNWISVGEPSQYDGQAGTSPSGQVYQLSLRGGSAKPVKPLTKLSMRGRLRGYGV